MKSIDQISLEVLESGYDNALDAIRKGVVAGLRLAADITEVYRNASEAKYDGAREAYYEGGMDRLDSLGQHFESLIPKEESK